MKKRIITGSVLFAGLAAIFAVRAFSGQLISQALGLYFFDMFIALCAIIAVGEVSRVFLRSGQANYMNALVYYVIFVFITFNWANNAQFNFIQHLLVQLALIAVLFIGSFFVSYLNKKALNKNENFLASGESSYLYSLKKAGLTTFIGVFPGLLISSLYLLNHIDYLGFNLTQTAYVGVDLGLFLLVLMFLTTIFTDTFAYFVGRRVGGPKLAPFISPNKTISGAIGGIMGATIISVFVYVLFNFNASFNLAFLNAEVSIWYFVIYGVLASTVSQAGDLFFSKLKRKARAKDFSTIFPGHGGVMDRLDGVSFNSLFTFIFAVIFLL